MKLLISLICLYSLNLWANDIEYKAYELRAEVVKTEVKANHVCWAKLNKSGTKKARFDLPHPYLEHTLKIYANGMEIISQSGGVKKECTQKNGKSKLKITYPHLATFEALKRNINDHRDNYPKSSVIIYFDYYEEKYLDPFMHQPIIFKKNISVIDDERNSMEDKFNSPLKLSNKNHSVIFDS